MGIRITTLDELKRTVKAYMSDLFDGPDDDEPNYASDVIADAVREAAEEWENES